MINMPKNQIIETQTKQR